MTAVPKLQDRRRYVISGTSNSWDHYVAPGGNRMLLVRFAARNVAAAAPSYDGTALTLVSGTSQDVSSGTNRRVVAWYYMLNPPSGVNTLALTVATTDSNNCTLHAFNLVDVDQTTPFRDQSGSNGVSAGATTGTTSTLTPASAVGDLVLDAVSCRRTPTADSGQTVIGGGAYTTGFERSASKPGEASSTSVGWTFAASDPWVHAALAVRGDATSQPEQADYTGARGKRSWLVSSNLAGKSVSASATSYVAVVPTVETSGNTDLVRTPIRRPCVVSLPFVRVSANATSAASTIAWQIDGSDSSMTITVPAGETGLFVGSGTATHNGSTDAVWRVTAGAGGALTIAMLGATVEADDDETVTLLGVHANGSSKIVPGADLYDIPSGRRGTSTTTAPAELYCPIEATWEGLYTVQTGTTTNGEFRFRSVKNGTNANQLVTYAASSGGTREDTSNSDTVSDGDMLAIRLTSDGTTGDFERERHTTRLIHADGEFLLVLGASPGSAGLNVTNGTVYAPVAGDFNAITTTEAASQARVPFDLALKRMLVFVGQHTSDGDTSSSWTRTT